MCLAIFNVADKSGGQVFLLSEKFLLGPPSYFVPSTLYLRRRQEEPARLWGPLVALESYNLIHQKWRKSGTILPIHLWTGILRLCRILPFIFYLKMLWPSRPLNCDCGFQEYGIIFK